MAVGKPGMSEIGKSIGASMLAHGPRHRGVSSAIPSKRDLESRIQHRRPLTYGRGRSSAGIADRPWLQGARHRQIRHESMLMRGLTLRFYKFTASSRPNCAFAGRPCWPSPRALDANFGPDPEGLVSEEELSPDGIAWRLHRDLRHGLAKPSCPTSSTWHNGRRFRISAQMRALAP